MQVKRLCLKNKAILIFDEVVTGFRTEKWCAANMFNVEPDLMCLSKAMANGFPISAVGGREDVMKVLEGDCFVSSSFGGDLVGISAALATIKVIEERGVIKHIWDRGAALKQAFNTAAQNDGIDAECIGYPCRTFFRFPSPLHKTVFWQECLKKGILFGHAQFITAAHGLHDTDEAIEAIRHAMRMLRKHKDNLEDLLEGEVAKETLRLVK
jgi:glutamate-1-semialdehyde 2,1-aminomutase/spore coat polysaccharide biosynthesis protein SpsF